jgi:hypothetical protein
MHLDEKVLLFAGSLHDIGKIMIDAEIIRKTQNFTEKNMEEMRKHPLYTYMLLRGIHEFSAEVALRHHRWQKNGYPKKLPKFRIPFSHNTELMIDFYARILSLADFYDSITTRVNEKFGEKRKLTQQEVKAITLAKNADQKHLIEDLYLNGIFSEETYFQTTPKQDVIYNCAWKNFEEKRTPKETRRCVTLACALEPLPEKIGCTTRDTNISPYLKLEYFIAGAINIGDAFEELAQRIQDKGSQPDLIYDLTFKAQQDCVKNRAGGRINHGIIEMLMPIVASQMIYDEEYKLSVEELLEKSKEFMKNTSKEDVEELIKMKRLAYDLSAYHEREVPVYPQAKNVYDYYSLDLKDSKNPTSIKHNEEFVLGFPSIKQMYNSVMNSRRKVFNKKIEDAYDEVRKDNHQNTGCGLTADCSACAIYLTLSHNPRNRIII